MKRNIFYVVALSLLCLVTSCYDDSELSERIDKLEVATVAGINQQLASLQSSLDLLTETYNSLDGTIGLLEATDATRQQQIDSLMNKKEALAKDIDGLQLSINNLRSWVGDMLEGYASSADLNTQLTVVQDSINAVSDRTNEQLAVILEQIQELQSKITQLFATLDILFEDVEGAIAYSPGGLVTVNYTLVNADEKTQVVCMADGGWTAKVTQKSAETGTITVTTPATGGDGRVLVLVGSTSNTIMRFLSFVEDEQADENRYTFVGLYWPQSVTQTDASLCGGELTKVIGKISGRTYAIDCGGMGSGFKNDIRATPEELEWLADYTAKPAKMDGFNNWVTRQFTLYPFGTPMPADCNQHGIGDCNTVSTLATMSYMYPRFIQSIIKQVSDKEFKVKMFDPDGKRIIVGVDNQVLCSSNGSVQQMTGKNGRLTWSTILEKAIMKWLYVFRPGKQLGGFGAEGMTPLFTGDGRSFAVSPGKCTAEELKLFVTVSIKHGLIVNGGFNKQGLKMGNHETITAHGHSFFLPNDPNALFAIRNPWGQGSDDHVMQCYDNDHAPSGYDGSIPSTIDLRIISPGIASLYYDGPREPYQIPKW